MRASGFAGLLGGTIMKHLSKRDIPAMAVSLMPSFASFIIGILRLILRLLFGGSSDELIM